MEAAKLSEEIQVGIAEFKVAKAPGRLATLGLGSCVGIALYDPAARVGGLLHIMLPDSTQFKNVKNPSKFADLGIPLMLNHLTGIGGRRSRLQAKLVGGAQMFSGLEKKLVLNIGERNAEMAKTILNALRIRIVAEEIGGNKGRTMFFDLSDGSVFIRTLGGKPVVI